MKDERIRKEVKLPPRCVDILSKLSQKDGRSLKNYMEHVLLIHAFSASAKPEKELKKSLK